MGMGHLCIPTSSIFVFNSTGGGKHAFQIHYAIVKKIHLDYLEILTHLALSLLTFLLLQTSHTPMPLVGVGHTVGPQSMLVNEHMNALTFHFSSSVQLTFA